MLTAKYSVPVLELNLNNEQLSIKRQDELIARYIKELSTALRASKDSKVERLLNRIVSDFPREIDRIKIAEAIAHKGIPKIACHISKFKIDDSRSVKSIATTLFSKNPSDISFAKFFKFSPQSLRLIAGELLDDAITTAPNINDSTSKFKILIERLTEILPSIFPDISVEELNYSEKIKLICNIECKNTASLLYIRDSFASEVQSEVEASKLFIAMLKEANDLPLHLPPNAFSRQVLKKLTGLNVDEIDQEISSNFALILYSTTLSFCEVFRNDNYSVSIDPSCWQKENRDKTLHILMLECAIKMLGGDCSELKLNTDTLQNYHDDASKRLAELFENRLDIKIPDTSLILELQRKWGDLSPLFILFGRYMAMDHPHQTIPVLKEIIVSCLEDRFGDLKYADKRQLPFASKIVNNWKKNPASVKYFEDIYDAPKTFEEKLAQIRSIVETNLIPHLTDSSYLESYDSSSRYSPNNFAGFMRTIRKEERFKKAIKILLSAVKKGDEQSIQDSANYILTNTEALQVRSDIRADIRNIKEVLNPRTQNRNKGYLIFSAIIDDPKSLLMIGDLVNAASCQNYRTGHLIKTLPGYVIDANIKALLSFVIPTSQLRENPNTLEILRNHIHEVSHIYNPALGTLDLSHTNFGTISLSVRKAMRRHILRLGMTENGAPSLLVERAYLQNHLIERTIASESTLLIEQFKSSIGAVYAATGTIFPASKNPCGVYSDTCGGVKIGRYRLQQ